uniref:Tyrosine-protein phosphatase domain-containing protein n=1 Tax=Panagrolaimus sp. ES5 TaxID=591445 RepID=A0AC34G542_9BILA
IDELFNKKSKEAKSEWLQLKKFKPGGNITFKESYKNLQKHRYGDQLCIDQTRVVLMSNKFINANKVKMVDKEFIATQGPLKDTVLDFWTMIYHSNCKNIVMLCNTVEGGFQKCWQYWPMNEKMNIEKQFELIVEEKKLVYGHNGLIVTTMLLKNL